MKVLVTGASGFIGTPVTRCLLERGHDVIVMTRDRGRLTRLGESVLHVEVVCGDLCGPELERLLHGVKPDLCIHLAWDVTPSTYVSSPQNLVMLEASLRLARWLASHHCARMVGVGTCFEYQPSDSALSEESPAVPQTLYGAAKLAAHDVLLRFGHSAGMQVAWPRLFYQFGPEENERRFVPSIIRTLLDGKHVEMNPGHQIRDYLHVADVAAAIVAVAESDLTGAVNIGSGQPRTLREIVDTLAGIIGVAHRVDYGAREYGSGEPMRLYADNRRLRTETRWRPRYDLNEGLLDTVEWWRQRQSVSTQIPRVNGTCA